MFTFVSWVFVCAGRAGHISAQCAMCRRGSSHVLRPSAPLSILVGALACGGQTRVMGKQQSASCEQACSGKIPPVSSLHNGQCSAYKVPILCLPIQEARRSFCARATDDIHNENVPLGFLFVCLSDVKCLIKGVVAWFSRADCSGSICIPEAWCGISNYVDCVITWDSGRGWSAQGSKKIRWRKRGTCMYLDYVIFSSEHLYVNSWGVGGNAMPHICSYTVSMQPSSSSAHLWTGLWGIPLRLSIAELMPSVGSWPNGFWIQWLSLHVTIAGREQIPLGETSCLCYF